MEIGWVVPRLLVLRLWGWNLDSVWFAVQELNLIYGK